MDKKKIKKELKWLAKKYLSADQKRFLRKILRTQNEGKITLRQICSSMKIGVPERFLSIADKPLDNLVLQEKRVLPGGVFFLLYESVDLKPLLERLVEKGVCVAFIEKAKFEAAGLKEEDYPVILMADKLEQVGAVFADYKKRYKAKTLAITGTVGKTTTNRFCNTIISKEYKTFASKGNRNSYMSTAYYIFYELTKQLQVYIQEVGAANKNSVRKSARMLGADAFILLNVTNHHMNLYGTYESLFSDKVSLDDYLKDDGIVIANFDDAGIAAHPFKHKVVSFGVHTEKEVDYRAVNIVQNKDILEFDVVYGETSTHVRIHILGKFNTYNALAAFAAAKWLDIDDKKIVKHLADYRTWGIRQNMQNIAGRYLYVDCYNACEASIVATLDTLGEFSVSEGNKKIAAVGGENALGKYAEETSKRIGRRIGNAQVDEIICVGREKRDMATINMYGDAQSVFEGIREVADGTHRLCTDMAEFESYIQNHFHPGDLLIMKGPAELDMTIAIDKLFGTSFTYDDLEYYVLRAKTIDDGRYHGRIIQEMGGSELQKIDRVASKLVIPDAFAGYPVFRIGKRAFMDCKKMKSVDFGSAIKNIGTDAFCHCTGIKSLDIPGNVRMIGKGAFRRCRNLSTVTLQRGVMHIGQDAFRDNPKLEKVVIPNTVLQIENDAFANSNKVVLVCEAGSFAERYAVENHIPYKNK